MAKQAYFFLSTDRSGTNAHYRIADPLSDELIRDEIVSRHVGWEFSKAPFVEPWASNSEILHLLIIRSSVFPDSDSSLGIGENRQYYQKLSN